MGVHGAGADWWERSGGLSNVPRILPKGERWRWAEKNDNKQVRRQPPVQSSRPQKGEVSSGGQKNGAINLPPPPHTATNTARVPAKGRR